MEDLENREDEVVNDGEDSVNLDKEIDDEAVYYVITLME